MKLIRQTCLFKQEATRLLIYEIDLCEVGANASGQAQFVVNFRQGQQGRALRDGTKTAMPVREARAERIYGDLVAGLLEKGYSSRRPAPGAPMPAPTPAVVAPASAPPAPALPPREAEIVSRLRNDGSGQPLDRVIWRAGQYQVQAAAPILVNLLKGANGLRYRTIAAALARIANPSSILTLQTLAGRADAAVRRMGQEGLRRTLTGSALDAQRDAWRGQLPGALLAAQGDALQEALTTAARENPAAIGYLYLLDDPATRPGLLQWLEAAPFRPPTFRVIRDLFKRAEVRDDGEVFGIIAARVDMTRSTRGYGEYDHRRRKWVQWKELVRDPNNTQYAFSRQTRKWWRRRIWRALDDRGKAGQAEAFCALATGYLKRFDETAAGPTGVKHWALGNLLHRNDDGYWIDSTKLRFLGNPADGGRVEAWPACWDACPDRLVELVCEARSSAVFAFALRALKANRSAWPQIPLARLIDLMRHDNRSVVNIAVEIAVSRYDARNPNHELVQGVACSQTPMARQAAFGWLRADAARFTADHALMQALLMCAHADTQGVATELLERAAPSDRDAVTMAVFEALITAPGDGVEALLSRAVERGTLTVAHLTALVDRVPALAGRLALADHRAPDDALTAALLRCEDADARAAGVTLLGRLPDHVLTQRYAVLVHLCTHADGAIRAAVRPIITRLAAGSSTFGESILSSLIEILRQPEAAEGAHADIVQLIKQALPTPLSRMDTDQVIRLAQSASGAVHQLIEGPVLALSGATLDLPDVIMLADHASVAIRRHAWQMLRGRTFDLKSAPDHLLTLVDAEWDDARAFAFGFIQDTFTALSPTVLVGLCDSVRPDVQQFGQRMINRLFDDAHGATYLSMLSQHPAPGVQLFVTNLLTRFATTPEKLLELEPYFMAVLCSVHRGKIAKGRVIRFLGSAAQRDETSATIVARIFAFVSASSQVQLHGAAVEGLVAIQALWPRIAVPLTTIEPAYRGARGLRGQRRSGVTDGV